jgi:hypothetical protein
MCPVSIHYIVYSRAHVDVTGLGPISNIGQKVKDRTSATLHTHAHVACVRMRALHAPGLYPYAQDRPVSF